MTEPLFLDDEVPCLIQDCDSLNASELLNTSLHPPSSSPNPEKLQGRSQSLQNLSNLQSLQSTIDSGYTKSVNHINLSNKHKKGKYDHVQSKIKLTLEENKKNRLSKKRLSKELQDYHIRNENSHSVLEEEIMDIDDLRKQLIEKNNIIEEQKGIIEAGTKRNAELILEISTYQIRMDDMRIDIHRLENELKNLKKSMKCETPISQRQFSMFKTPIRSISKTLLSPFRSANKFNVASERDSSSSESENEKEDDNANFKSPTCTNENKADTSTGSHSNQPLLKRKTKKSKLERAKDVVLNILKCPGNECENSYSQIPMENVKTKTRKTGKVYPEFVDTEKKHHDNDEMDRIKIPSIYLQLSKK